MDRHLTSAQLKSRAKGQLLGKYGTLIPVVIIVQIIQEVMMRLSRATDRRIR